jgi:rRNA-processing protein FCF1
MERGTWRAAQAFVTEMKSAKGDTDAVTETLEAEAEARFRDYVASNDHPLSRELATKNRKALLSWAKSETR